LLISKKKPVPSGKKGRRARRSLREKRGGEELQSTSAHVRRKGINGRAARNGKNVKKRKILYFIHLNSLKVNV
jgi:hypothetical protein